MTDDSCFACSKMQRTKRAPNINQEQKDILIEFMKQNPHLNAGKFAKEFTYKDGQKKWVELANILNTVPEGGSKSWKQWRKVWHDLKSKSKHKKSTSNNKTRTGVTVRIKMEPNKLNPAMVYSNKRAPNINQEQKHILTGYLSKNPQLAEGKFTKDFTYKDGQKMWLEIANLLNAVPGGGSKSWKQWRKVWQDLKGKAKTRKPIVNNKVETGSRNPTEDTSNQNNKCIQRIVPPVDNLTNKKLKLKEDYYNKKLLLYEKHLELLDKDVKAKCDIADSLKTLTNILSHNTTKHENYDF